MRELVKQLDAQNLTSAGQKLKAVEQRLKSSELRKVKTPSEVIAAHEALEILNSESDDAAGYMQKVCR